MVPVGICGHYGGGKVFLDGQTVKTKTITAELKKHFGDDEVLTVDTYGGARKIFKHLTQLRRLTAECENVIILPAHNGIRIFAPFLTFINRFYRHRLHYVVIGGWLPKLLSKHHSLVSKLKQFDCIYVETSGMAKKLEAMGFDNITVMKNCNDLQILSSKNLKTEFEEPYPLCTFSRVNKEKGIEDAVEAVENVNRVLGRTVFSLDIYGQIEETYQERFQSIQELFPEYIRYSGCVPFEQTTDVLRSYYAMIFPTHYFTEGIPGSVIDAYASGVPVISARWENFQDIIQENVTGFGFDFED